jgi:hypothetical protein
MVENFLKNFLPYFIIKPTEQGAGLDFSLAYDMVTKWHGGTFRS